MATKCIHRFHDNISSGDTYGRFRNGKPGEPTGYLMYKNTLFVIDFTNYRQKCARCETEFDIYFHGPWPEFKVSFDGKTDLRILAKIDNILFPIFYKTYNVANFGAILYGMYGYGHLISREHIIYTLQGELKTLSNPRRLLFNGKGVVCFVNADYEFILIDSDGKIINLTCVEMDADGSPHFRSSNGTLSYTMTDAETLKWTYTNAPALRTKAALS